MKTEKNVQVTSGENQIVVYQPNETIRLDVRLENETMWLTQAQLCELFQRDVSVISRHIKNVFAEGELEKESNLHFLQIANSDRPVAMYSLDVIISVGYRVKSVIGTRFRQWANKVLKEYILHGYAINDRIERLEQKVLKHDEQINLVLQTALPPIQGVFYDGQLWDARALVLQLIARAKHSLILIDNWATPEVLDLARAFSKQYPKLTIRYNETFHDRFLIIDDRELYLIGASLKDLGGKCFGFTKMDAGEIRRIKKTAFSATP